mmetsp:Transcript_48501/g.112347  ORF Transcript_48501/g.112347 Transcript_48501/m.112347 type:complete len:248 (-) Transcript_48501:425-1168(-)
MADVANALRAREALSTIGPPWNCGPTEAQYLFASPCICGHSMKRRWLGMIVGRNGELTAIVCRSASSGRSVFSMAAVMCCASGSRTIYSTIDRWREAHWEPWNTSGRLALGQRNSRPAYTMGAVRDQQHLRLPTTCIASGRWLSARRETRNARPSSHSTQQNLRKFSCILYRRGSRLRCTILMTERPGNRPKKSRTSWSTRKARSASLRLMTYSKPRLRARMDANASSSTSIMLHPAHMTARVRRMK